jgi:Ca2+-binding EF-hand superfamily protein
LDNDGNGNIDRFEFVNGITRMDLTGIEDKRELKDLFDFMDANGDEELSRDEFACYIKGAEKTNEEKIRSLPEDLKNQMRANIQELFASMDDDKNGKLDVHELYHAY